RQGPLRVGSVRRAPCESTDCHPRSEQIYRSGSVAFSCLASCGFLICSDLNFNLGPLFEASLFLSHPSTYSRCEFPDTDHRLRQGPLRVGSVRRAPCESTDCHPRSEQIYRSGSVAFSCLASCGFLICSDLNFNLGPLFEASLFLSHPSTYSRCEFPDTDHRLR